MQFLQALIDQVRLTWRLMRDPRVPVYLKVLPFLGFIYVISPLDFIPDMIIGLGQLDDLGVILIGMKMFETLAPAHLVEEHRLAIQSGVPMQAPRTDVIDGTKLKREKAKRG
jgi:uncharacterized membrane protein YkvA (DUF1232 family)